ncbi:MAG: hypothetical protein LQ346_005751 [Caloplaca aetnensis]|nr:MAG: hypothetical protein LQ346_005751 [Caloplaca aetnensis]
MHLRKGLFLLGALAYSAIAAPTPYAVHSQSPESSAVQTSQHGPRDIPPDLPYTIQPAGGTPAQPSGTKLVQIGFDYGLNWPFVVNNGQAQAQIFYFTVPGLAYGLDIGEDRVTMHSLRAYDTSAELGYITTLALAFIPTESVDRLASDLHVSGAQIYNNPDSSVRSLFAHINPDLPFYPTA